ncbi:hypothetical protein GQ607_014735 [Colletotrichum asianum]|uniref:Uncharacterized protein n=1 Tax=Colletotrichum asianum TaxID=702518 RepID=A0A8H3ZG92_9PEZI|nr:hypothetical protein GQ607_014735 [Colletotrichum asianum]
MQHRASIRKAPKDVPGEMMQMIDNNVVAYLEREVETNYPKMVESPTTTVTRNRTSGPEAEPNTSSLARDKRNPSTVQRDLTDAGLAVLDAFVSPTQHDVTYTVKTCGREWKQKSRYVALGYTDAGIGRVGKELEGSAGAAISKLKLRIPSGGTSKKICKP